MTTRIGIFVFDGAEELDWAGPWEVLASWAEAHPDECEVFTVARSDRNVRCAKGLKITADHDWTSAPPIDVLVYPGGRGTRSQLGDADINRWLGDVRGSGALLTSVCTGSLVFADAGLLDDRPATTHWGSLDHLATLGSRIDVRPEDRYVDDGDIITAAGVSAGIDMALHLIVRFAGADRAREIRRYIQYDPLPPV